MSEKPMPLTDDEKSGQVTSRTDHIMNNDEARRAFFEHAENGNLYSPAPPEFEAFELQDETPVINETLWTQPENGFVEPPEFAQPPRSHEDEMKETIDHLTELQCVQALGALSLETVAMRHRN